MEKLFFLLLIVFVNLKSFSAIKECNLIEVNKTHTSKFSEITIEKHLDENFNPYYLVTGFLIGEAISKVADKTCDKYFDGSDACKHITNIISFVSSVRKKILKNSLKRIIRLPKNQKKIRLFKNGKSEISYYSGKDILNYSFKTTTNLVAEEIVKQLIKKQFLNCSKEIKQNNNSNINYNNVNNPTQILDEVIIKKPKYKLVKGIKVKIKEKKCKKLIKGICYE